jgi:hypothetical protein
MATLHATLRCPFGGSEYEFVLAENLTFQCSGSTLTRELMSKARENFWRHKDRCCERKDFNDGELGLNVFGPFTQAAILDLISMSRI